MIKIKRNDYNRVILFTENILVKPPSSSPPIIKIPDFIKNLDKLDKK